MTSNDEVETVETIIQQVEGTTSMHAWDGSVTGYVISADDWRATRAALRRIEAQLAAARSALAAVREVRAAQVESEGR